MENVFQLPLLNKRLTAEIYQTEFLHLFGLQTEILIPIGGPRSVRRGRDPADRVISIL